MWKLIRYFFFLLEAEKAHYMAMNILSVALKIPILNYFLKISFRFEDVRLNTTLNGMKANSAIGLAAGFDKDGRWLEVLSVIGFGHIEVGTVTPLPQDGNPKPRLFRLKKDRSIINRMGFNNEGVDALVNRLQKFKKPKGLILGGNIGKNKLTSPEQTIQDYIICFNALFNYVDYFAINVSSPNTPGLRSLQDKEPLHALLSSIQAENQKRDYPKPLFLKIAPDLEENALKDIVDVVLENNFSGIISNNTTLERPDALLEKELAKESGGLSGAELTRKSNRILKYVKAHSGGQLSIIGVGGIMNSEDAIERLNSGANWIQIYSGFIYGGPWMIKKIKKDLSQNPY